MMCNDDAFIVVLSVCGRGPQEHCYARVNIDIHNTDCNMLQSNTHKSVIIHIHDTWWYRPRRNTLQSSGIYLEVGHAVFLYADIFI